MSLTEFTRRFRKDERARPPIMTMAVTTGIAEVNELDRAFVDMLEALERSREQIVRAGKLAVVGEMAAIMAHEVRTPLGILKSSAQLLERQPDLGERERELIGFISSETERLNRLVTLLLECARPRPPEFEARDVHEIIANVTGLLAGKAEKKRVRLLTEPDAAHAILLCDREQLTQVFLNLVLNALDFVPEGGRIGIRTRDADDALIVSVYDDGPGIAPALRTSVFDPFFSRREGGIGLGLTIVQQIVQVHHADITIADSPWGGAQFDIRFPHSQPAA
jgi:signal transduction histidine kinase